MIGSVNLSKRVVQTRPTKEGLQPTQHCTTEHLKHLLRDSGAISAFLDGKGTIVHFDDNTGHQNNCQVHFEFLKYGENSKSEQNSVTTQHSCFKNWRLLCLNLHWTLEANSCISTQAILSFPLLSGQQLPRDYGLLPRNNMSPQEQKGSLVSFYTTRIREVK